MTDMTTSIIVAMAENRVIGVENDLPWHIPEDLKRFKALTMGKPVIMGRKTFQSIFARLGKPLPGRTNIVVSRSGFEEDGVLSCVDIEHAVDTARHIAALNDQDEVFIIGGAQVYAQALPLADRLYLTEVRVSPEGDAFFPEIAPSEWMETAREDHEGDPSYAFVTLERCFSATNGHE